jgi:hypothetical protein
LITSKRKLRKRIQYFAETTGSGYRLSGESGLDDQNLKNLQEKFQYIFFNSSLKAFQAKKKLPALYRKHPTLQNVRF